MAHAVPMISADGGLSRYLTEIRRFPMLEPEQEFMLAKRWREHGDRAAAQELVQSHLRLVAKIAMVTADTACRSAKSCPKATSA